MRPVIQKRLQASGSLPKFSKVRKKSARPVRTGAPLDEPATVTDASKKDTSIRNVSLIHLRGRPAVRGPHERHKDARPVTDAGGPVNTCHPRTHTGTEHKLGLKAQQEWAGRRRPDDPPGPQSSEGRARRFPPNSTGPTRRRSWAPPHRPARAWASTRRLGIMKRGRT